LSNYYSDKHLTPAQRDIREIAMADLRAFVGLVAPYRMFGHCHHDLMNFLMEEDSHQLVLWPRGHQKSTLIAYWAAWWLIKHPESTIIIASATADLAEKQLGFIKDTILDTPIVKKYWKELISDEEGKRSMWRNSEIAVDHPRRAQEGIRDPSIKAVGMGGNLTGFHGDVVLLDDIVVDENSQTKTERDRVKRWASLLVSILNPGGMVKAVGTRYHPDDLYNDLIKMEEDIFDDEGVSIRSEAVYKVSTKVVEEDGQFLWPRQQRKDGKWYGFDNKELARIRAQYLDKSQFYAQYYNDPSDPDNKRIENFQYYDRDRIKMEQGQWKIGSKVLNVYAAIDFAATITARSDYTAIVVIGVDDEHRIYILDIDRFKTNKISEMAERLEKAYNKWRWIKLRAEINAQQGLIVSQIREYNRKRGVFYTIDTINQVVNKQIRIMTNLEQRYAEGVIFHFRGGNCQVLEDELSSSKPAHDDVSDAFASCVEIATAPSKRRTEMNTVTNIRYHPKFGGVS